MDFVEEAFHLALEIDCLSKGYSFSKSGSSVLNMRDMDIMITIASRRVDMLISYLVMMLTRELLRISMFLPSLLVSMRIY